jgi:hypothetical protein
VPRGGHRGRLTPFTPWLGFDTVAEVYWLQPPSVIRRAGAILLIVSALAWDVRSGSTEPFPVASRPIAAGTAIDAADVAWIDLPEARLPIPDLAGAVAARDVGVGEPLTTALLASAVTPPEGWWTVPLVIGTTATAGDEALLVVADPPLSVVGLVIASQVGDRYDLNHRPASVAVPADAAPLIAAAERSGLLVTAIRSAS